MNNPLDEILTAKEAGEFLGYSHRYINILLSKGVFSSAVVRGQSWLIKKTEIEAFANNKKGRVKVTAILADINGEDFLTTKEAAEMLKVSMAYLHELIKKGFFVGARREGRFWFIPAEEVKTYMAERENRQEKDKQKV